MSNAHYTELWLIARNDLEKFLELDRIVQEKPATYIKKDILSSTLPQYLKYRNLVKRLIICHDQMVQTQKRRLIKRVLDCAIGRMLEYKREIVNVEYTDYQWPDDIMTQLKFTPDDVEITTSATGKDFLKQRRKFIQELMDNAHRPAKMASLPSAIEIEKSTESEVSDAAFRLRQHSKKRTKLNHENESSAVVINEESPDQVGSKEARLAAEQAMQSAMLLVQSHERARIGRSVAAQTKKMRDYNRKVAAGEIIPKKMDKMKFMKAVMIIQRAWKRYVARRAEKKRVARIEEILGSTIPSWKSREVFEKDEQNFHHRLELMPKFAAQMEKATTEERARLLRIRGPGLMEDITDEIREWFIIWYNELGHFDLFPAEKLGGSVLIATGQTLTPHEYLVEKAKKTKDAGKTKDDKSAEKKGGKKKEEKKKASGWNMPKTQAFSCLEEANEDFIENWSFRDESANPLQKEYVDLIRNELCHELQLETRKVVDELMRLELEKLNKALLKDHAGDPTFDAPIAKKAKAKKKKGKKKGKKDPLGNVPVEDLLNELVQQKIVKSYPETSLKDWIGDFSYQNYEAALEQRECKHRLGEIRQVVMESCVLPLASKEVHQIAPLTRSVCIWGPARCGKSFLANAICSEVGALLFDMTPHGLLGKYVGKKNEQKLINIISKVARAYSPSVIFIDNAEKTWAKKVSDEDRFYQPKRFARYFPKFVKSIKPGDQILFLTTSSEPYKATGPFIRIHDKFIMIPLMDYNTLYMFYKDLLMKYHGVDRNIDVSCLAKMSVGVPLEFIRQAVEKVLNLRRRITLKIQPLAPQEIIDEVIAYEAPKAKIMNQLVKFEKRTPLGKKRAKLLAEMANKQQTEKGKGQKARK